MVDEWGRQMSDDLIERLRGYGDGNNDLMDAAADRIEKLEAALRKISQQDTLWGAICKAKHALGDFDRKALEGKDG